MGKLLVAIPAHADDVELNAGGTVAKWAAEGGSVHIIMATNNCSGVAIREGGDESQARRLLPQETTAIRHREQEAAAALIGAEVHYLDYSQRHYWDGEREISIGYEHDAPADPGVAGLPTILIAFQKAKHHRALGELLVSLKPDLVLTHGIYDLDPEHHAVCSLVWAAFRAHQADLADVPLRFWTPGTSCPHGMVDANYDHFEDISDFYEKKLELCHCHVSQMSRVRLEMVRKRAELYGVKMGVRHAEPFKTANRIYGL